MPISIVLRNFCTGCTLAPVVAAEIIGKAQLLSEHPQLGRPIAGRPEFRQIVLQVLGAAYVFQYVGAG